MTSWRKVCGTQEVEPALFDTTSSQYYVYFRRNMKLVRDEMTHTHWEYEELKVPKKHLINKMAGYLETQAHILELKEKLNDLESASITLFELAEKIASSEGE